MKLRDYQTDIVNNIRQAVYSGADAVMCQLQTGGGKTAIEASIIFSLMGNKKTVLHIYPRNEIGFQVEDHLRKWNVQFKHIKGGSNFSNAFGVHLISKDTLTRRWNNIIEHDYTIIDEAHLNYDFQKEYRKKYPNTKIIGFTATPEKMTGEGLSKQGGGIYDTLVEGVSIPDLTSRGFLAPLRYFSPPIEGIRELHRKGTEYDESELDDLLTKKRIYGEAIDHYRKYADKKPALVFTRSVKSAYETAERFNQAGYNFYALEGKSGSNERKTILDALRQGKIDGVVSCELFVYGLDIPNVEVGICLRPTLSRALYMQMIGRILRPSQGKTAAMFFDHVGNLYEHQEPHAPGVPLHYLDKIDWNFHGKEKRKRVKTDERLTTLRLCSNCYMYFEGNICPNCGTACGTKQREELKKVEAELTEIEPIALSDRPPEEKKEYIDRIESAVGRYSSIGDCQAVTDMIRIADELGNQPMWVYHKLNPEKRCSVNVTLLGEICRIKKYSPKWIWVQTQKLKGRF